MIKRLKKSMLKKIRQLPFLNKIISNLLKACLSVLHKATYRWRLSGEYEVSVSGIQIKKHCFCDDGFTDNLFYNRGYNEEKDLTLFASLAENSTNLIDIGANTGVYSIVTAIKNPHVNIHAFEAYPINYERLKKNISLNNVKNITINNIAVGAANGTVNFCVPNNNDISLTASANHSFSKKTYSGGVEWKEIQVPLVSIDSYIEKNNIGKIDLIKIDVEGYEMPVFEGLKHTIKMHHPTILFECFEGEAQLSFFNDILSSSKYYAYQLLPTGILYLGKTMKPNYDGMNFMFSTQLYTENYISFNQLWNGDSII